MGRGKKKAGASAGLHDQFRCAGNLFRAKCPCDRAPVPK